MTSPAQRAPRPSSLADVLDVVLDKGIVIDAYVRVSAIGIELLTIDARVVIAERRHLSALRGGGEPARARPGGRTEGPTPADGTGDRGRGQDGHEEEAQSPRRARHRFRGEGHRPSRLGRVQVRRFATGDRSPTHATLSGSGTPTRLRRTTGRSAASCRRTWAEGAVGSRRTTGTPSSPAIRSATSSGTCASSGAPISSASCCPPPEPNSAARGAGLADERGHVLDDAGDRHPRVLGHPADPAGDRARPPACGVVTASSAAVGHQLEQRQRDVAGAGREVEQQHVEITPVDVGEELLERLVQHRPAPDDGLVLGTRKPVDHQPDAVCLDREHDPAQRDRRPSHAEQVGHRVAPDVGIEQADG